MAKYWVTIDRVITFMYEIEADSEEAAVNMNNYEDKDLVATDISEEICGIVAEEADNG